MFGIGFPELIVILVIALIVIGPSKLPDLARALGKGLAEFKKASQEIKDSLNLDGEFREMKDDLTGSVSSIYGGRDVPDGEIEDHGGHEAGEGPNKDPMVTGSEGEKEKKADE